MLKVTPLLQRRVPISRRPLRQLRQQLPPRLLKLVTQLLLKPKPLAAARLQLQQLVETTSRPLPAPWAVLLRLSFQARETDRFLSMEILLSQSEPPCNDLAVSSTTPVLMTLTLASSPGELDNVIHRTLSAQRPPHLVHPATATPTAAAAAVTTARQTTRPLIAALLAVTLPMETQQALLEVSARAPTPASSSPTALMAAMSLHLPQ